MVCMPTIRRLAASANARMARGVHTFTIVGPYIQYFLPFSRADRLSGLYSRIRHMPPGPNKAAAFKGGNSFPGFMKNIRRDAEATLSEAEKAELRPILEARPAPTAPSTAGPERNTSTGGCPAEGGVPQPLATGSCGVDVT